MTDINKNQDDSIDETIKKYRTQGLAGWPTAANSQKLLTDVGITKGIYNDYLVDQQNNKLCKPGEPGGVKCMDRKKKIQIASDLIKSKNLEKIAKNLYKSSLTRYSELLYGSPDKMMDKQTLHFEQEAKPHVKNFEKKFESLSDKTKSLIYTYDSTATYSDNIDVLRDSYNSQNDKIKEEIEKKITKNLTDERKTYYESNALDNIKWYTFILLIIYAITFICYVVILFINRNKFTTHNKWVTLIGYYGLMGLYPKLMGLVAGGILAIINFLYKKSPRDVYVDL